MESPDITASPVSIQTCDNGGAIFTVTETGEEPLSYQWQENENILANSSSIYSGINTGTLIITNDNGKDGNLYNCIYHGSKWV